MWLESEAYCSECSSILKGHCLVEPDEKCGISISVSVPDTKGIPHYKKRANSCESRECGRVLKHKAKSATGMELLDTHLDIRWWTRGRKRHLGTAWESIPKGFGGQAGRR